MRKPDRPTLFKKGTPPERWSYIVNIDIVVPSSYVLDDGGLLHQLSCSKGSTYKNLAEYYVLHVRRHYSTVTIVLQQPFINKSKST